MTDEHLRYHHDVFFICFVVECGNRVTSLMSRKRASFEIVIANEEGRWTVVSAGGGCFPNRNRTTNT
jgi:hypothetical protein